MNSKAQVDPIKLIVAFIVIGVVAAVVLFGFHKMFGKEVNTVDKSINSLGDADNDGKPDFLNQWQDATNDTKNNEDENSP